MRLIVLFSMLLVAACPDVAPAPGEGEGEGEDALEAALLRYAEAECFFEETCLRADELRPSTDFSRCVEQLARGHRGSFFTTRRRFDVDNADACAAQMLNCDVAFDARAPCLNVFAGESGSGEACTSTRECAPLAELACVVDAAGCRSCEELKVIGDPCVNGRDCRPDDICDRSTSPPSCQLAPLVGAPCDVDVTSADFGPGGCGMRAFCDGDVRSADGVREGICVPQIPRVGDRCLHRCTGLKIGGLFCDDGRCAEVEVVDIGAACDLLEFGAVPLNRRFCVDPSFNECQPDGTGAGVCVARAGSCRGACNGDEACVEGSCRSRIGVAPGESCGGERFCTDGVCDDGVCRAPTVVGDACVDDNCDDFEVQLCVDGFCVDRDGFCSEP